MMIPLLISTFFLAVTGLSAAFILWKTGCRSSRTARIAWFVVLLQGVVWFHVPINVRVPVKGEPANRLEFPVAPLSREVDAVFSHEENVNIIQQPAENPVVLPLPNPKVNTSAAPSYERLPAIAWEFILPLVWCCGILLLVLRYSFSCWRSLRAIHRLPEATGVYGDEWKSLLAHEKIADGTMKLLFSDGFGPGLVRLPRSWAVVVPHVLWEEAAPSVRIGILKHELSHYKHRDLYGSLLVHLLKTLHWFNPLAYYAARRFDEAAEWRCDAEAFGACENGTFDFAATLLAFRDTSPVSVLVHQPFSQNKIKSRVERLIDYNAGKRDTIMKNTLILGAMLLLLGLGLFRFNPVPIVVADGKPVATPNEAASNIDAKTIAITTKDETGVPLVGVEIRTNLPRDEALPTATDENGKIELTLPKKFDDLIISALAKGRVTQLVHWGKNDLVSETVIPAEIDFTLRRGTAIGGTVVDVAGKPIEGAEVRVICRRNGYQMPGHLKPEDSHILTWGKGFWNVLGGTDWCRTDQDGKWSLDNVPEGDAFPMEIEIEHPDYLPNKYLSAFPETTPQTAQTFALLRDRTQKFVMQHGLRFSGTVQDENGQPIAGALVVWNSPDYEYYESRQNAAKTDENGHYTSVPFKPGTVGATVIAEGFAPDVQTIDLRNDKTPRVLDFTMKQGKPLEIHFVDSDGLPVPGVEFRLMNYGDNQWRGPYSNLCNDPETKIPDKADENGVYRWTWAPADAVHARLHKEGFLGYFADYPYWFKPGEVPQKVVMNRLGVRGIVVDRETGKPLESFVLTPGNFSGPGVGTNWQNYQTSNWRNRTDGTFVYNIPFNYEKWRVKIDADGYEPYISRTLLVNEGEKGMVDLGTISLEKSTANPPENKDAISGTVVRPDGTPAANVQIRWAAENRFVSLTPPNVGNEILPYITSAVSDEQGRFTILPALGPNRNLYFVGPDGYCTMKSDDFQPDQTVPLLAYAKLRAKVDVDSEPDAYNNFQVTAYDRRGHLSYNAVASTEGIVELDFLVPGKYGFMKMKRSETQPNSTYNVSSFSFEIAEGETKELDLRAPAGAKKVIGRLRVPDLYWPKISEEKWLNESLSSVSLVAASIKIGEEMHENPWGFYQRPKMDPDNPQELMFEFPNIPPGEYTMTGHLTQGGSFAPNEPGKSLGSVFQKITVPAHSDTVLDLGKIEIRINP